MTDPAVEYLDNVKATCGAATKGPWEERPKFEIPYIKVDGEAGVHKSAARVYREENAYCVVYCYEDEEDFPGVNTDANAVFIARSRSSVPRMAEALTVALEKFEEIGCHWEREEDQRPCSERDCWALNDYCESCYAIEKITEILTEESDS